MSALYNLEPQPTASCILHTTAGDISLELFAQQTPLTCRNFLQHCLDGYYDNTIFHRLVPGFILQGGDPTGTGNGGESIYDRGAFNESREEHGTWPDEERRGRNKGSQGVGFKDEIHSRLKFNRRGLLAMANEGADVPGEGTNGSQFFITLGVTAELQGKNTIFGRVEGETIYNVARMGEAEVGDNDRMVYPVSITSVEILVNPFKDMVRRERVAPVMAQEKVVEKKKKRKSGKQLLSFGDEEGDEEVQPVVKKAKFDTRIVMGNDGDDTPPKIEVKESKKKATRQIKVVLIESSPEPELVPKTLPNRAAKKEKEVSLSPEPEPVQKVSSLLERTNAQIAELKASMKRNTAAAPVKEKKKSALEAMISATSVRGRKRHPGGQILKDGDPKSLDILKAFRDQLAQATPSKSDPKFASQLEDMTAANKGGDDESDDEAALCDLHFIANCQSCSKWDAHAEESDDDNDDGWMSHALSFKEDKLGKDLSYRKKAEEEMVVIDPREKARTLKEEKKAHREARSGANSRMWDQERNDKLARASALAGRGAK
ncbi:cyclophilin-like domain-containing protein [Calycina marina]|uniref:peptidylprolyl isomerase n=1 Tax=Calycina marina TaxID=1763456 RepID=A0A9P7YYV9_9HELO|nr:cyclophilin-like domain-containing protein [Calycina marina]